MNCQSHFINQVGNLFRRATNKGVIERLIALNPDAMNVSTEIFFTLWNKGKLVGQKAPLKLKDIWAIRVRLQLAKKTRDLALFK